MIAGLILAALAAAPTSPPPDFAGCPSGRFAIAAARPLPARPGHPVIGAQFARGPAPRRYEALPESFAVCEGNWVRTGTNHVYLGDPSEGAPLVDLAPETEQVVSLPTRGNPFKMIVELIATHLRASQRGPEEGIGARGDRPCPPPTGQIPGRAVFRIAGLGTGSDNVVVAPQAIALPVCASDKTVVAQVFINDQAAGAETPLRDGMFVDLPAKVPALTRFEVRIRRPGSVATSGWITVDPAAKVPDLPAAVCTLAAGRAAPASHAGDLAAWLAVIAVAPDSTAADPYEAMQGAVGLCTAPGAAAA